MFFLAVLARAIKSILAADELKTKGITVSPGALRLVGPRPDTCSTVAFAKLYDRKTPMTAADLLNDRVLPFFEKHEITL